MTGAVRRRCASVLRIVSLLTVLLASGLPTNAARAQEKRIPVRWIPVDATAPETWPEGDWEPVALDQLEAYLNGDDAKPPAGYLENVVYVATLSRPDLMEGQAKGVLRLHHGPDLIPLGASSCAITSATIDEQKAAWGADADGRTYVMAPRDGAAFGFQWSLQGQKRSRGAEFRFDGLASASARLELTAGNEPLTVEGGVIVERRTTGEKTTYVIEMGARSRCVVRINDTPTSRSDFIDCELHQIVSASPTKLVVQSDIGILPRETGPHVVSVPIGAGYSVLRVMLPGGEGLPFERGGAGGNDLQISFPELTAGRKTVCRVVIEKPVDWSTAIDLPRVGPANARLLRETWNVQFEKPLEVSTVEHPGFVQTGLNAEETREVWSFQGLQSERSLKITAGPPEPILDAVIVSRGRRADSRGEITAAVQLTSRRTRGFNCELEIRRPWTVVSIDSQRPGGGARAVTWEVVRELADSQYVRIELPQSVSQNAPVLLSIVAAAPAAAMDEGAFATAIGPVVAGSIDRWVIAGAADQTLSTNPLGTWKSAEMAEIPGELSKLVTKADAASADAPRAWRYSVALPTPATPPTPVIAGPSGAPEAATSDAGATNSSAASPTIAATAIIEVRMAEAGAREHLASATLMFNQPTACAGWALTFERAVSTIDVLGDGRPIEFAVDGASLRLPAELEDLRQVTVRYRVNAASGWLSTRDQIPLPTPPCQISQWVCRIENSASRFIAETPQPAAGASGLREISWTRRWFGPLGRAAGESMFHPLARDSWSELRGTNEPRQQSPGSILDSDRPGHLVTAFGFAYPTGLSIRTVWEHRFEWLCWAASIGSLLTGLAIRRVVNAAYRTASLGAGIAATAALLGPAPWSALAGSVLFGIVAAFLIPRAFVRSNSAEPSPPTVSSSLILGRSATATIILMTWLTSMPSGWAADGEPFEVLIPVHDDFEENVAWVSPALRSEFDRWERLRRPLTWLVQDAQYKLAVNGQDAAPIELRFELLSLSPDQLVQVPLIFEGVSFQSADSATLDGEPLRLTPLKGAQGIVIPLIPKKPSDSEGSSAVRVRRSVLVLRGQVRTTMRQGTTGLQLTVPSAGGASATVQFQGAAPSEFRSTARGRRDWSGELAEWAIGSGSKVSAVWRTNAEGAADRGQNGETEVLGRAESIVLIEAEYLRCRTRVTLESPEASDPFASPRLRILLPSEATVSAATGNGVQGWLVAEEAGSRFLWIDLDASPAAPQEVDLEYILPRKSGTEFEIPAMPLLAGDGLRSHQIALAASQSFQIRMLTSADPEAGVWEVAPSEASFSLRRDAALAMPQAAVELEIPQPVNVEIQERLVQRQVEIEQTLTPELGRVHWDGYLRIETSGRSAFMHTLAIDPRIQVESVSVLEKDLNRLLRFVRQDDRLLILLRDDVPGTQLVRLSGYLSVSPQEWDAPPKLELQEARITRSEIILNASELGRFETRWAEGAGDSAARATTDASSGQRLKIDSSSAIPAFRWLPARSNVTAEQFVRIVDDAGSLSALIDWSLTGDPAVLRELEVDLPETAEGIEVLGDYVEATRRAYPHGGARIRLAALDPQRSRSTLSIRVTPRGGASLSDALPRLVELIPAPTARWVLAPIQLFDRLDGGGTRLDALPATSPPGWQNDFASGQFFAMQTGSWRLRSEVDLSNEPLGTAIADTVIAVDGSTIEGLTKMIVLPARTGALAIRPPVDGRIQALWIDERSVELPPVNDELKGLAVLRSGLPVAVVIRWSSPHTSSGWGSIVPVLPTLDRFEMQRSSVMVEAPGRWLVSGEERGSSASIREGMRRRQEVLLEAALSAPAGLTLPTWLITELRSIRDDLPKTDAAGVRLRQIDSLLEQQAAIGSAAQAPPNAAQMRDEWTLFQASDAILRSAATDPQSAALSGQQAATLWLAPRSFVLSTLAGVWLVGFVLLLRRLLKLATRWQIADRLADHAGLTLLVTGVLWWLVLSPSVLGLALVVAVALYRALPQRLRHRP